MKDINDFIVSEPIVVGMLGFVYYVPYSCFLKIIEEFSDKLCSGSKIIFDIDCSGEKATTHMVATHKTVS